MVGVQGVGETAERHPEALKQQSVKLTIKENKKGDCEQDADAIDSNNDIKEGDKGDSKNEDLADTKAPGEAKGKAMGTAKGQAKDREGNIDDDGGKEAGEEDGEKDTLHVAGPNDEQGEGSPHSVE
jgi:hypothetical protein